MKTSILTLTVVSLLTAPLTFAGPKEALDKAMEMKKQEVENLEDEYKAQSARTATTMPVVGLVTAAAAAAGKYSYDMIKRSRSEWLSIGRPLGKMGAAASGAAAGTAMIVGGTSLYRLKTAGDRVDHAKEQYETLDNLIKEGQEPAAAPPAAAPAAPAHSNEGTAELNAN